ncbi:uncharacterized protein Tsp33B [Maniola hyperantus]|uniref:uncharacterized protein Tsp33B n=1 Tax=Aphantopus hyperantus TaxID=2795564 RepID=UPI001568CCDD|nr:peripherin-2-like [Maniola hyperantus]
MANEKLNHPLFVWAACILWLISIFSICWSLLLFCVIGDVLILTGTDVVNALVLLLGIIMLPVNLYIIYAVAKGEEIDVKAKIVCCQLRFCFYWIILINIVGVVFCVQSICNSYEITKNPIITSMKNYRTTAKHKRFIDNLQWSLGCCGMHSYKDWFKYDWHDKVRDYEWSPPNSRDVRSLNDSKEETDSVPLSCCKSGSCVSSFLEELGTESINTAGCINMVHRIIIVFMGAHILMFVIIIVLEVFLLKYSKNSPKKKKSFVSKYCSDRFKKTFNIRNIMPVNDKFEVSSASYEEIDSIDHQDHDN